MPKKNFFEILKERGSVALLLVVFLVGVVLMAIYQNSREEEALIEKTLKTAVKEWQWGEKDHPTTGERQIDDLVLRHEIRFLGAEGVEARINAIRKNNPRCVFARAVRHRDGTIEVSYPETDLDHGAASCFPTDDFNF